MLEDKLLIWKFNRGDRDALLGIYEKYKNDLVSLAAALLIDAGLAEDVVHDVFVTFIRSLPQFRLTGSLKSFLATCVANTARNRNRAERRRSCAGLDEAGTIEADAKSPEWGAIFGEESSRLTRAIGELPYEQREALLLRSHSGLKFKAIAVSQGVSASTVRGRYRYAVDKLRSALDGEVRK
ncbi:MAG: RNA polymerase sigma factor [Planctomycetota bacterium]